MDIEKLKNRYVESLDDLEKESKMLLERIEKARKEISSISTTEDADKFARNNDLEVGLKHIRLFE